MLHVVLSGAIFRFLSLYECRWEWSLRENMYFGFQSEPSFQSEPVYYIPAPLPYVFWWLRERLHKQAKIEWLGASTCRRYLAFTDRTSSLCAVCLADGMWSLTWFTSPKLGIPAKGGKMEHLLDVWPNSGIKISAHLVALKFRTEVVLCVCLLPSTASVLIQFVMGCLLISRTQLLKKNQSEF